MTGSKYKFWGWDRERQYALEMVAAILERGDDKLRDGFSGAKYSDAHWVIDILLGQLGYEVVVSEDGDVTLERQAEDGYESEVIRPDHYRPKKKDDD